MCQALGYTLKSTHDTGNSRVHFYDTTVKKSPQPRGLESRMLENTQQVNGVRIWKEIHRRAKQDSKKFLLLIRKVYHVIQHTASCVQ